MINSIQIVLSFILELSLVFELYVIYWKYILENNLIHEMSLDINYIFFDYNDFNVQKA